MREKYEYIGSTDSPYSGGLTNTFTFKAFELGINCIFNAGGYVRTQPTYSIMGTTAARIPTVTSCSAGAVTIRSGTLPALLDGNVDPDSYIALGGLNVYENLSLWVKKQNYLRVQSIRLGYSLPFELTKKWGISQASVSLEGRNLLVFGSDYTNFLDPETMGNPYGHTPIPKSVTLSILI